MHTAAGVVSGPSTGRHLVKQTQAPAATGDAARPVLPPNVNSRPHGTLTVRFGSFRESSGAGVRWNSAKVYVSVDLQLIWWGQQTPSSSAASCSSGGSGAGPLLHWEQGNARLNEASEVVYEVRTSPELFRRYLKSCEPIRVRLVSKRTRTVIGTAQVQIPGKITNFRDPGSVGPATTTVAQACGEVHSVRGFCLGEVCLELSLQFDRKRSAPSGGAGTGKENGEMLLVEQKPPSPALMPLAVEGKPAPLHESSQRTLPAAGAAKKRFHTLAPDARQKILDYLTGRPIDADGSNSELCALSEIRSVSPAESMLEALTRYDRAPEPRKQTYLRAVDCVRVLVENLKFTRAGQKEIQHRANQQHLAMFGAGFVVRMKLLPTATRLKFTSTAVSEAEVVFDAKPQQARFGLPDSATGEGLQFEFGVHLNVGSFYKTRLFFLGSASVTLQEVIEGRFACHKRCPIRLASDDILLGTLTVRLELGSRGIHFGPELIDAVLIDGGNVTLESSEASSVDGESVEPSVTPEPIPSVIHCQHKHHHCHGSEERFVERFPCYVSKCKTAMTDPGDNQSPSGENDTSSHNQPSRQGGEASGTSTNGGGGNRDEQNKNAPQKNDKQREPPKAMEIDGSGPEVQQAKLLHGLLYLGQLKDRNQPAAEHFLALQPFWADEPSTLTSELCQPEGNFDYLRTFPVLATASFLERVRNQHLAVELWQKASGEGEKLVGVTRLPLHQFYIAFRDVQLSDHLAHARLPVISIDGWSGIGSPLASKPCGQLQAVLAIGTESQIEHFRLTRSLPMHTSGDVPRNRLPVIDPARIYPRSDSKSIQTMSCGGGTKQPQSSEVANMLSAFIENLAQRLPISSERSTAPSFDNSSSTVEQRPVAGSPHSQANRPQLRKTADLLDNLQKALAQRPSAAALEGFGALGLGSAASLLGASTTPADQTPPAAGTDETRTSTAVTGEPPVAPQHPPPEGLPMEASESEQPSAEKPASQPIPAISTEDSSTDGGVEEESCKLIRLLIEIERAVNLPQLTISKKYAKRQHHKNRVPNVPEALVLEPSAYATFEGHNLSPGTANTVKSHEGIVYTTHVIERNCAPGWQKRFEVQLPSDLMTNDEKRFIVKVWRKAALSDAPKCRLLPAPMEDAVIGFCAIDLSLLLSGLSCILGWYNIMDFSGRCNGQIKIYIKPLENVQSFKVAEEQQNFRLPLSIDVDCGPTMGLDTSSNTSLSRALKRKFIELEEITERLKARLFDVTGDDGDDDGTDPDDQFERDLNTAASEDDDDADDDDQDGWAGDEQLEDSSNRKRNSQYPNGAMTITTNTSSYSMCATDRSSLTGCSNRASRSRDESPPPRPSTSQLAELLQTHDIDTLINPALFKNILHPSTSESTPVLDGGEPGTDADMSDESSVGGAAGGDRVKQIATALQRTTISDTIRPGEPQSSRAVMVPAEGDGNGGPCREAPEGEPMKDVNK